MGAWEEAYRYHKEMHPNDPDWRAREWANQSVRMESNQFSSSGYRPGYLERTAGQFPNCIDLRC